MAKLLENYWVVTEGFIPWFTIIFLKWWLQTNLLYKAENAFLFAALTVDAAGVPFILLLCIQICILQIIHFNLRKVQLVLNLWIPRHLRLVLARRVLFCVFVLVFRVKNVLNSVIAVVKFAFDVLFAFRREISNVLIIHFFEDLLFDIGFGAVQIVLDVKVFPLNNWLDVWLIAL